MIMHILSVNVRNPQFIQIVWLTWISVVECCDGIWTWLVSALRPSEVSRLKWVASAPLLVKVMVREIVWPTTCKPKSTSWLSTPSLFGGQIQKTRISISISREELLAPVHSWWFKHTEANRVRLLYQDSKAVLFDCGKPMSHPQTYLCKRKESLFRQNQEQLGGYSHNLVVTL